MTSDLTPLLDIDDVAKIYKVAPSTIERWVSQGKGPAPIRLDGRQVRWEPAVIAADIAARRARAA